MPIVRFEGREMNEIQINEWNPSNAIRSERQKLNTHKYLF